MDIYCKKNIVKIENLTNKKVFDSKEEKITETFNEIIDSKLMKMRKQICELKIINHRKNLRQYDEVISDIDEVFKNYKNGKRIKKEWKLYDNIFSVDINYPKKKFKVDKVLSHWNYESHREYFVK